MKNTFLIFILLLSLYGCQQEKTLDEKYAPLIAELTEDPVIEELQSISRERERLIFSSTTLNDANMEGVDVRLAVRDEARAAEKLADANFLEPEKLAKLFSDWISLDRQYYFRVLAKAESISKEDREELVALIYDRVNTDPGLSEEDAKEIVIAGHLKKIDPK